MTHIHRFSPISRQLALCLCLSVLWSVVASAQDRPRMLSPNNVNVILLGNGSAFSFTYERLLVVGPTSILAASGGLGYASETRFCLGGCAGEPDYYLTFPHQLTANFGQGDHFFELGLGGTVVLGNTEENYFLYPILGWRVHPIRSGDLVFRLFATMPFSGLDTADLLWVPVGASLGWIF
ncbi:MAG: hypothetical protein KDC54_23555 [Lewinella sp.]|nr:hypothetical protein [Lewinella sp.]